MIDKRKQGWMNRVMGQLELDFDIVIDIDYYDDYWGELYYADCSPAEAIRDYMES